MFTPACCMCPAGQYCYETSGGYQCRSYGGQLKVIQQTTMVSSNVQSTLLDGPMCSR